MMMPIMKIANGYPKEIKEVFKGVPNNINAVFIWGKDGKTYFFSTIIINIMIEIKK